MIKIIVLAFLGFLLFYPALGSYFSQDDFHHLKTIMDKNLSDIPSFFTNWQEGQTFYRPLSREIFNLLMYRTFGLNPLPFHMVNLLQIFTIAYLTYLLILKLTKQSFAAFLGAVFYLLNPVHNVELYYLASVQMLFATIFIISSLIFYISYLREGSLKKLILAILFFILALISHTMAIVFVPMIVGVTFFEKKSIKKIISKKLVLTLIPFLILGFTYILFSSLLNLPQQKVYQPVFSLKTIANTLEWYILWSFGLPEMMVDFIGPGLHVNPNLIRWYKDYLIVTLPVLGFSMTALLLLAINFRQIIWKEKFLILFTFNFITSLSTFLLFPQHKFVSYLSLAIVWFGASLGYLLSRLWSQGSWGKLGTVGLITCFAVVSWQTTALNVKTHWAAKRAVAAKFILNDIKSNYPQVTKGSVFYFKNDPSYPDIAKEWGTSSKQAFYILSGSDSLRLLYGDSSIKVYFEDLIKIPENIDHEKIINYVAKFPY